MGRNAAAKTLAILGATGYTGRLCAQEAVARGIPVTLAGRDPAKLDALLAELGDVEGVRSAVVDVTDGVALRALAEQADVLITTVGPYQAWGRPALLAALDGGAHYLDVSGEVDFLQWARTRDVEARQAGIALCPGFGFDGVPGDLLAGVAAAELGALADEAKVAYLVRHARASGGTLRSIVGIARFGGLVWRDGDLRHEPVAAQRWDAPFPEPLGTRAAVSAPLPDVLTIGESVGAAQATAFFVTPAAALLPPLSAPLGKLNKLAMNSGIGRALEAAAARAPEGPSPAQRQRTLAAVIAEVRAQDRVVRAWGRLRDPYQVTARIVIGVAQRLLAADVAPTGALTPTTLLGGGAGDFLREIGVDWALC